MSKVEGGWRDVWESFPLEISGPVASCWRILQESAFDDAIAKLTRMRGSWTDEDGRVSKGERLGTCLSNLVTVDVAVRSQQLVEAVD